MTVQVLIEGRAARSAAEDLAALPGLTVNLEPARADGAKKEPSTLAAVAAIVGIAGGIGTLADQILRWRDRWRASRDSTDEKQVERIILVIDDRRTKLDGVTAETMEKELGRAFGPGS
ncbi:MAG: hypothetical protein ACLPKE_33820 [Streptosporangiaceae bacterium]